MILILSFFKKRNNRDEELNKVVISFLTSQLILYGKNPSDLPSKARDKYSLGYITGVIDAIFERSTIDDVQNRKFESFKSVTQQLFGSKDSKVAFSLLCNSIENDVEFYEAMSDGGTEFIKYINKQVIIPSEWARYIYDISDLT